MLFRLLLPLILSALVSPPVLAQAPSGEGTPSGETTSDAPLLERLVNSDEPFQFDKVWNWFLEHAASLVVILLGALILQWLVSVVSHRIVDVLTKRALRGSQIERENRARTLSSVFHNAATTVIYLGAVLILLDEFGIPISTLLGGVAVFGLAVAFGAQNLIKDYFYGFMILLENQYGVNDVIKIGGISGLVERITLRLTVLRDQEGTVHFIPHGEVKTVSNMTHGWSRAVFDIGIAYAENPDRVMDVLMQLAQELRQDPAFAERILEDPEMLGVEGLGESSIVIRFHIKTAPKQQWSVKRELLRRIKRKFDELGIEIPFPSRTIYYRQAEGEEKSTADGTENADKPTRNSE